MPSLSPLPPVVRTALSQGHEIEAIRLLREHTGLSLADAKAAVEQEGVMVSLGTTSTGPEGQLPPHVLAALAQGEKFEAIKLLREATGLGLNEAKSAVEAAEAAGAPHAGHRAMATPGEMPPSALRGRLWPWLVVGLVATVAYMLLRVG